MLLGFSGDLKRLQFTIGFIIVWFKVLAGIAAIYIFADIFSKAVLSVLLRDYFMGIIKFIVTPYRIIIILLKDFLL